MRSILRFHKLSGTSFFDVMDLFRSEDGRPALNSTPWRDKPPRSCCVVNLSSEKEAVNEATGEVQRVWDIQVEYRSPDVVTYVGDTKYLGWQVHRQELFDVYPTIEFNDLDFGTFVGESEIKPIPTITTKEFYGPDEVGKRFSMGSSVVCVFPRRVRTSSKVVLFDQISFDRRQQIGFRPVSKLSPNWKQQVADELTVLVDGFLEGRIEMSAIKVEDSTLINLNKAFVEVLGPGLKQHLDLITFAVVCRIVFWSILRQGYKITSLYNALLLMMVMCTESLLVLRRQKK